MTQPSHTVHTLSGTYALNALDPEERREFEAHLAECDTCAQEVRELRETTARLGAAAAGRAPDGLRAKVLAEAARTRQAPPRLEARPAARRPGPALLGLAAAACLVIMLALGVAAYRADQRADRVQAQRDEVYSVLAAPDARAATGPVSTGGRGTVVVSRQRDRAVVVMAGLARAPSARTYELWLMGEGEPKPAGTMTTASAPVVIQRVGRATQIGITVEPAGGSAAPTGAPVFAVELPA
ncbi:anti-sigma factor [Actinomadura macrotermitis]|uniref:Regulator of SigK n=1 Tax=Actinomadura macrotermitis TaxID=2585200 RepID=A0A7K0BRH7_9ACTN|nr:Anti-sigma-K factor RskA [Actinomadura macrotermitis]